MSGVAIIRYMLANNSALVALLPSAKSVIAGTPPLAYPLPVLTITQISGMPRLTLGMSEARRLHTDRVQVTAIVKGPQGQPPGLGYPGVKALMAAVLNACPNTRGTINGFDVDSILPDVEGPDFDDPEAAVYSQSRDFIVKFRWPT